ncbi:MAG: TetR/AcrR family transcriptional regulator [Anaerofustis sp.]
MKTKTPKGELTQKKLLGIAKDYFYKYGYKNTTMAKIANEAGISAGNLTYHFSSKDKLLQMIFDEYNEKILEFVEKNILDVNDPMYLEKKYMCMGMIFNTNILKDEKTTSFFKYVMKDHSLYDIVAKSMDPIYKEIADKYSLRMSFPLVYRYITRADQEARKSILLTYIEDRKKMPELDMSMLMMHYSMQFLGIPEINYYKMGISCYTLLLKSDFSHIKLLQ